MQPTEDFILVIDADMIMRQPFNPVALGAGPGWAISAFFTYMKGVSNELALRHVPQVTPREDNLAGPPGRRGDQVGGFTLMSTKDLEKVAPMWLSFTTAVRNDPTVSFRHPIDGYTYTRHMCMLMFSCHIEQQNYLFVAMLSSLTTALGWSGCQHFHYSLPCC